MQSFTVNLSSGCVLHAAHQRQSHDSSLFAIVLIIAHSFQRDTTQVVTPCDYTGVAERGGGVSGQLRI